MGFRIHTEPTILALKNETIWSGFLWYLAPPSGQYYVHYGSIANPLKIVNNWFCSLLFLGLLKFQELIVIGPKSMVA